MRLPLYPLQVLVESVAAIIPILHPACVLALDIAIIIVGIFILKGSKRISRTRLSGCLGISGDLPACTWSDASHLHSLQLYALIGTAPARLRAHARVTIVGYPSFIVLIPVYGPSRLRYLRQLAQLAGLAAILGARIERCTWLHVTACSVAAVSRGAVLILLVCQAVAALVVMLVYREWTLVGKHER